MSDKGQKGTKVKCKHDESASDSQYLWNKYFFSKSIWVFLVFICKRRQNFTIIDQEKHQFIR